MATRTGALDRKNSSLMFRQITPPHGWKEDSAFYHLRLTLPGFETKDIKIHVDKYDHLVVRGDKQVSEHKYISFEETFEVPNNGDLDEASGSFEDNQIYCITIPKKQGGRVTGHAITIPKQDNGPKGQDNRIGSSHKYDHSPKQEELTPMNGITRHNIDNPLAVVTGHKYKRKIALLGVVIVALVISGVVIYLVKFHHS
ncbi:Unknown protein [Striga hermonthica]|uniref:SHSP domain-containing protein n=1 Tax=Striga hermonthica TaxID=68872 RepID=A0A9N7RE43_STRHE|nr:Unknown protein [Striga hermonthica]